MFDAKTIGEIASISGLGQSELTALKSRFETIGQHFRKVILGVPTNMTLGPSDKASAARQKWLREEVQRPIAQLLDSIDQPTMLASWPDQISTQLTDSERLQLRGLLVRLQSFAEDLCESLQTRTVDSSTINAELRFDLVSRLADACREAGIPIARKYFAGKGNMAPVAQIIQLACKTICGAPFPIDHQLRDYLKLHQAKKHKS
jgi:hypothetical protein